MRTSGASELENFHDYIHLPMQLLTITHNSAPLPTLCLLYFTVPRQGQKFAFRDLKLRKMPFSSTKNALGTPATALDCAPSGAMRKVHGDNFPVLPSP